MGEPRNMAYLLCIDDHEYRWFQSVYMLEGMAELARDEILAVFPGIKLDILAVPLSRQIAPPHGARLYRADDATDPEAIPVDWENSGLEQDDYGIAEHGDHIFQWVEKRLEWGELVWRAD